MCDTFLDLFSNLFSLVFFFFLNCGYLFCLTCKNNQRNYERAESEELARVHSFMTSAKILKFEPSHPSSPLCITIHIWSKQISFLEVFNLHSNPTPV